MKLNGWHRLGIVVFVLWAIGISIFMWSDINTQAGYSAEAMRSGCEYGNKNHLQKEVDCSNLYNEKFEESRWEILKKEWWGFPLVIFAPPLLISILWLFSYGAVRIFYWIKAGFFSREKPLSVLKYSVIVTCSIISLLLVLVVISKVNEKVEAEKTKTIETNIAQCELEAIKSKIDEPGDRSEYIKTCMQAKGYNFVYKTSCGNGYRDADMNFCYQ